MEDFKVKFRGVRGSFPVCHKNFMLFGGNTSCVEVNVGGHLILLDAGTGIILSSPCCWHKKRTVNKKLTVQNSNR